MLVWMTAAVVVVFAFLAFAIDFGRVQLARAELQSTADAAALAAAAELPSIADAISGAQVMAAANTADGSGTTLVVGNADETLNDVQFVKWDPLGSYTVLSGAARAQANAVRVTARRTVARGTAVQLLFGGAIGLPPLDADASSIASPNIKSYAIVGLDFITMGGNTTASYSSKSGSAVTSNYGNIASNGNITLSGSSYINGNALPGVGGSVNSPSKVGGSVTPLKEALVFPALPVGSPTNFASVNDNDNFNTYNGIRTGPPSTPNFGLSGSNSYTLPGGTYFANNFSVGSSVSLSFTGPTTIYCFGNFTMSGHTVTSSSLPQNLTVVMVYQNGQPPGTVTIGSSSALYGTVYAPYSAVTLSGTGDIYGSVLGKSITMSGSSRIVYDRALSATGPAMTLVR